MQFEARMRSVREPYRSYGERTEHIRNDEMRRQRGSS
jgi:hypothetical protein